MFSDKLKERKELFSGLLNFNAGHMWGRSGLPALSKTMLLTLIFLLWVMKIPKSINLWKRCVQRLFSQPLFIPLFPSVLSNVSLHVSVCLCACRCHCKFRPPWYCHDRGAETLFVYAPLPVQHHWNFFFQGECCLCPHDPSMWFVGLSSWVGRTILIIVENQVHMEEELEESSSEMLPQTPQCTGKLWTVKTKCCTTNANMLGQRWIQKLICKL